MRKYGNKQAVAFDGKVFSSRRECKRYEDLRLLEKIGEIEDLQCQVKWTLVPMQPKVLKQRAERAVTYTSDFQYFDKQGKFHVEDSKGFQTQQYIIRRKLMRWVHGVSIEEV